MINFEQISTKSPFTPLQEHMKKSIEAIKPLKSFFEALIEGNDAQIEELRIKVINAEKSADKIKNEIRNNLPRSIFLPIDRRDLLEILDIQDDIADTAEDIATLLALRKMILPGELKDDLLQYMGVVEIACEMALQISEELDELIQCGFCDKEYDKIYGMIDSLSETETRTDDLLLELNRKLFLMESKMKPMDVMFWYEIFEWIGNLADYAEKMGNRLRVWMTRA